MHIKFCVILCGCQCQFFQTFDFLIFCEILSRLRKNVGVTLAFRVLLEAHFRAPQNCQNWALVRTRAQLLQFWGARKWASKSTLNANMTPTFFLRRDKFSQKITNVQSVKIFAMSNLTDMHIFFSLSYVHVSASSSESFDTLNFCDFLWNLVSS